VLVIAAPGQGAQTPGFLSPWLEDATFASRFEWLSTVSDLDLAHYGTEADAETIRDTRIAQPLLVATGLIAALELFPHPADAFSQIGAVAGHSVGEIAAAAGARVITAEQAMVLVRERGKAMADASAATPTGMTAVLGGDRDTAQLVSVAILELRIKLNRIDDSELKALCDAMVRDAEPPEKPPHPKSHEGQRGRSPVSLKLVK
jgi:malonyl CoA-acyl carrier protein transacylase